MQNLKNKGDLFQETPASILFIVVSRIGDTLFSTPSIRAVAETWPNSRITVLGHPSRAVVFEHLDFISRVGNITKHIAVWKGWLPGKAFDLAFVYNFDKALVAYALRVAHRVVALDQGCNYINRRLYKCVEPAKFQSRHAVDQLLCLPNALGIMANNRRIAYQPSKAEQQESIRKLKDIGVDQAFPKIGLQAASFPTKGYRDWPIQHFAKLCHLISIRWPSAVFFIFGGKEERERTHWLNTTLGESSILFAGQLTLRETGSMMGLTDCYIGVDTGPTHIMSSYNIPMIGLYHCVSSSSNTGPLDHPCAYLIDLPRSECQPCSENSSMAAITVEMVFSKVKQVLEKGISI